MKKYLSIFLALALIFSCKNSEKIGSTIEMEQLETFYVQSEPDEIPYRPTTPLVWDLVHTHLKLKFSMASAEVIGWEEIVLKPHFYHQDSVVLDAKWMQVNSVSLPGSEKLDYVHKDGKLSIRLDKTYGSDDTLRLQIDYVAQPELNKEGGGRAIRDSKGIYFINYTGKDRYKPQQIWTQGETHFSSCWFPTLDEPNQKTTQEIELTVDTSLTTLSNGTLEFSTVNGDGTKTDYWAQDKAHSPYLFMLAIGEFTVTKDQWRDVEVSYFLEKNYEADARYIFGNTAEMIEYYSNLLGVDYPWDKYAQVVVRDFVSGAMENTSATLHGSFVQNHKRELLDYNPDGIIAHELFHQWFGDLVSCESWSNLPLNEAFATYGEFLWSEYKYGREQADLELDNDLKAYLRESNYKQEDWVRFHYMAKDDMFDAHSYSKGGRILHMLRHTVGDSAFFQSLGLYLNRFAHQSAEMHDLRLCFEKVTGEDMNWFFNQWAFASGHPDLLIEHSYDTNALVYNLKITQTQDPRSTPIYKIPLKIAVYQTSGVEELDVMIEGKTFTWSHPGQRPLWVNVDADKYLLCTKTENLTDDELWLKFTQGPKLKDKLEVLAILESKGDLNDLQKEIIQKAMSDNFHGVRKRGVELGHKLGAANYTQLALDLEKIAVNDPDPKVRSRALYEHSRYAEKSKKLSLAMTLTEDESYAVASAALFNLVDLDSALAFEVAQEHKMEESRKMQKAVTHVFSRCANEDFLPFMVEAERHFDGYNKIYYTRYFTEYAERMSNPAVVSECIDHLVYLFEANSNKTIRKECVKGVRKLSQMAQSKLPAEELGSDNPNPWSMTVQRADDGLKLMWDQNTDEALEIYFSR